MHLFIPSHSTAGVYIYIHIQMKKIPHSPRVGGKLELLLSKEERESEILESGRGVDEEGKEQKPEEQDEAAAIAAEEEEEARKKKQLKKQQLAKKIFLNTASLVGLRAFCSLDVLVGHLFDQTDLKKKDGSPLIIDLMGT